MLPPRYKSAQEGKISFNTPEAVTGFIILGGVFAGVGFLLTRIIFPILIGAIGYQFALGIMLVIATLSVFLMFDRKFRTLFLTAYQLKMMKFMSLFVNMDPISVLESYVTKMKGDLREMGKQIGSLRGQMRRLTKQMASNRENIDKSMHQASEAKLKSKESLVAVKARKAGRLRQSNEKYEELYKKMDILNQILSRIYKQTEILLEDVSDQVEVKAMERKAIIASHKAMQSAKSIIRGNSKKEIFDKAMEAVAEDVGNKVVEIGRFLDLSGNFMESIDIQNGIFEEEGLKMLEQLEKRTATMFLEDGEDQEMDLEKKSEEALDLNNPQKEKLKDTLNPYSDLFDGD